MPIQLLAQVHLVPLDSTMPVRFRKKPPENNVKFCHEKFNKFHTNVAWILKTTSGRKRRSAQQIFADNIASLKTAMGLRVPGGFPG